MSLFANIYNPIDITTGLRTTDESKWLKIYSIDVTKTLKFGTQLNGGFSYAEFLVDMLEDAAAIFHKAFLGAHVIVTDSTSARLYEGFISRTETVDEGIQVYSDGHWLKGKKIYFDMIYVSRPEAYNLVTNPSFEYFVHTSIYSFPGWYLYQGINQNDIFAYDTDKYVGTYCVRIHQDRNNEVILCDNIPVNSGETYTLSFYAKKLSQLNRDPYVQVWDYYDTTNGKLAEMQVTGLATTWWQRYQVTFTATSSQVIIMLLVQSRNTNNDSANYSWLVDAVQVESASTATPYFDGSSSGCSWTGSANDSISHRPAEYIPAYQMIKDAVEMMDDEWGPLFYDYEGCDYPNTSIDFSNVKVSDAIEKVLENGYSDTGEIRQVYFALWNNRIAYIIPEPYDNKPKWIAGSAHIIKGSERSSFSLENVYNRIWGVYSDGDYGPVKTAYPAESDESQYLFGEMEGMIQANQAELGTVAFDLQDLAMKKYRMPRRNRSVEIINVLDAAGVELPPYLVRAGDVISIAATNDPIAFQEQFFSNEDYQTYTGFIIKTEYDASEGVNKIYFNDADTSIEAIFGRLGLSGTVE